MQRQRGSSRNLAPRDIEWKQSHKLSYTSGCKNEADLSVNAEVVTVPSILIDRCDTDAESILSTLTSFLLSDFYNCLTFWAVDLT